MRTRLLITMLVTAALLVGALSVFSPRAELAGPASPVPAEYADLYSTLAARLKAADASVTSRWNGQKSDVIFSAELLAANGNIGEPLLRPETWQAILVNLDALQALGVRGVRVATKYPILVTTFPRSGEYLEFYKRLSEELKKRNLKWLAQMTDVFREPEFSTLNIGPYYAGLTLERYKQEKRQMAETIIREIHPDYLTLVNEPATDQHNTGLPMTVQNFTEVVRYALNGLDRAGVQVGAGTGTWDPLAYMQSLAQNTAVDYLDMHIYPISRDYLVDRVLSIGDIARRANKKLVIGESWLNKVRDQELRGQAIAAAPAIFGRDVFSFWAPLDTAFVDTIVKLSHYQKIEFTSFFWSRYFFGNLEYSDATRRLPFGELSRMANQAAARNMMMTPPQFTPTGLAYQRLIKTGF
jgi:hypothetical protein